jgi:hypothetical protein
MIANNTSIKLLLAIAITVSFLGCKQEPKHFLFQPNTTSFFAYTNGSTWIYQLQTNASVGDTVISADFATGLADRSEGKVEVLTSTLIGAKEAKIIIRGEAIPTQNVDRIAVLNLDKGLFIPSPVIINIGGAFNAEDSSSVTKIASLTVNGKIYNDVLEINLKGNPFFKKLWIARNVGIIKKVYLNNDTFNIVSFTAGS